MRGYTSSTCIGVATLIAAFVGVWRQALTAGEFEMALTFAAGAIAMPQKLSDPRVLPKLDAIEDVARAHTDAIATNGGRIADVQRKVTGVANALATRL
nr:hypothetical protein [uncultured Lichenicoccus sp.]